MPVLPASRRLLPWAARLNLRPCDVALLRENHSLAVVAQFRAASVSERFRGGTESHGQATSRRLPGGWGDVRESPQRGLAARFPPRCGSGAYRAPCFPRLSACFPMPATRRSAAALHAVPSAAPSLLRSSYEIGRA